MAEVSSQQPYQAGTATVAAGQVGQCEVATSSQDPHAGLPVLAATSSAQGLQGPLSSGSPGEAAEPHSLPS